MSRQITLKIADIIFQISHLRQSQATWLEKNFQVFLSSQSPDLQISLKFNKDWQKMRGSSFKPCAKWHHGYFYSQTKSFNLAIDFAAGRAEVLADYDLGIVDLIRFLYSIMLLKRGGFLLHASAILNGGFSYVFFGPSESGKSTIARLSKDKVVLTDETTAIVKHNGDYYAYSTPFAGELDQTKQNISAPIKALFAIKKDNRFRKYRLRAREAVKEMVCNTIITNAEFKTLDTLFDTLQSLAERLPCYRLHFKPEPTIWSYIHGFVK